MAQAQRRVTGAQARRFVLRRQGLLGGWRYRGEEGVLRYIGEAGCVQFDPVSVCGRSPELALHARVEGYNSALLETLLYGKRLVVEHFDKNLSYFLSKDWPYFRRDRLALSQGWRAGDNREGMEAVLREIRDQGPKSSGESSLKDKVDWHWGPTTLARAAMEQLYFEGELLVHRRQGIVRTFDLASRCLPPGIADAPDPLPDDAEHLRWRALRRVRAVGLLWNRASMASLGIPGMKAAGRQQAFSGLLQRGEILSEQVEGVKDTLYLAAQDEPELDAAAQADQEPPRCALLPPLDCMLWDRALIEALFGFQYTWEIYTPARKRVYGSYVLPILLGERFVGRVEPVCDRKKGLLTVRGLWWEEGFTPDAAALRALEGALAALAAFNGCRLPG